MFQEFFKGFQPCSRDLKGVYNVFHGCWKGILRVLEVVSGVSLVVLEFFEQKEWGNTR